jgi:eukaryotic-like serine/threonine-protein kinase
MSVRLTVVSGPHRGREFNFDGHDLFLAGRSNQAHFQLADKFFSRIHFLVEVNPPWCRLSDLGSHNGTYVNGRRVTQMILRPGDEIKAGHTELRVERAAATDPGQNSPGVNLETLGTLRTPASPEPPAKPVEIHGYRFVRELGRGRMGRVFLAVREEDGREMAIKTILPAVQNDPALVKQFLREAEVLGQLCHPHIVEYFELGEVDESMYFVMEYAAGNDLASILAARGPLDVRVAVRLAGQLLQGLAFAHESGFVHHYIKPANILLAQLDDKRIAKITNFGLANMYYMSQISGLTLTGEAGITADYLAPEQITHYRGAAPAADQYSIAAILYHALTGHPPFEPAPNPAAMFLRILEENPVSIRDRRPEAPAALAEVVHRALKKDPVNRFPTVEAFRQALLPFAK